MSNIRYYFIMSRLLPVLGILCLVTMGWAAPKTPRVNAIPHDAEKAETPPAIMLKTGDDVVGRVWLAYDNEKLYLRYRILDPSPLKNCGDDWKMLFKTGDSVDLQLGLDPKAPSDRKTPAEGDIRLLMTRTKAGLTAVIYRYKVPGTETPVEYGSPTGHVTVDRVEQLKPAEIALAVKNLDDGYELTAAIPWALLVGKPFSPQPGTVMRGDLGVLFSDPDGGVTVERIYWANKDTAVVADVPSEIRLQPDKWGEIILSAVK